MAHDEAPIGKFNVGLIELAEPADTSPTLQLSGALYVSGGAIWAKGYGGTNTLLAAS